MPPTIIGRVVLVDLEPMQVGVLRIHVAPYMASHTGWLKQHIDCGCAMCGSRLLQSTNALADAIDDAIDTMLPAHLQVVSR